MNRIITEKMDELVQLCEQYRVETLYLFGSAVTNDFNADSDIDFLVVFGKTITIEEYTDSFFGMQYGLRDLFNREIDLVTENSLSNPYLIQSIEQTKRLIYAA